MARVRWEVRWLTAPDNWNVYRDGEYLVRYSTKALAVRVAAEMCRNALAQDGTLSELYIKTKAGRIGKGSSGRRTYGKDPRGSKG